MKKLIVIICCLLFLLPLSCADTTEEETWKYSMGDYVMFTEEIPKHSIFLSQTAYVLSTIENYKDWGKTYQLKLVDGRTILFSKSYLERVTMKTQKHYFDEEKQRRR